MSLPLKQMLQGLHQHLAVQHVSMLIYAAQNRADSAVILHAGEGEPLPDRCGIAPMAEEYFRGTGLACGDLIGALVQVDKLLSEGVPEAH